MKKGLFFLGLASMMSAFVGCTKDTAEAGGAGNSQNGVVNNPDLVIAMPEGDELTRTMLDATGKNVLWEKGDRIAVLSEQNNSSFKVRYTLDGEGGTGTGVFKYDPATGADYEISLYPCGRTGNAGRLDPVKQAYVAVYPYNTPEPYRQKGGQSSDPNFSLGSTIPTEQVYMEGSYDKKALPMIAVFDKTTTKVQFRYLGALAKIPVAGEGIKLKSVKLGAVPSGASCINPSGNIYIQFSSLMNGVSTGKTEAELWTKLTNPTAKWSAELAGGMLVTLKPGDNAPIELTPEEGTIDLAGTVKPLYFGIVPRDYEYGLIATLYREDGAAYFRSYRGVAKATNVYAGSVLSLKPITLSNNMYIPNATISGEEISFTKAESGVDKYRLVGLINGKEIIIHNAGAIRLFDMELSVAEVNAGKVNIKKLFASDFEAFAKSSYGSSVDMQFVLRANYTDNSQIGGTISKPMDYKFVIAVDIKPEIIFAGSKLNGCVVSMANKERFTDHQYAYKVGTLTLVEFVESDFKALGQFGWSTTFPLGENTIVMRGKLQGATEYTTTLLNFNVEKPKLKPEFAVFGSNGSVTLESKENNVSFEEYYKSFTPKTTEIYWKEGVNADMTDLTGASSVIAGRGVEIDPDSIDGSIPFDKISADLDPTKKYTFLVKLASPNYPDGEVRQAVGNYTGLINQ